jgi:hypothetical protein
MQFMDIKAYGTYNYLCAYEHKDHIEGIPPCSLPGLNLQRPINCSCYSVAILESSGKLNKKALATMSVTGEVSSANLQDSEFTQMGQRLAAIWCRVLKLKDIDVHENFFDLGG